MLCSSHAHCLFCLLLPPAGKTLVPLEGDSSISRVNETNLGNYVCDAFLRSVPQAVAAKAGGNVTICFMNAGGIRTGYKVGSWLAGKLASWASVPASAPGR